MGFNEATEDLKKLSKEDEDIEVNEWLKMSNDLSWELKQPYVDFQKSNYLYLFYPRIIYFLFTVIREASSPRILA